MSAASPVAKVMGRFFTPRASPALQAVLAIARAIPRLVRSPIVRLELAAALRRKRFVAIFTGALLVEVAILVGTIVVNADEDQVKLGQSIFWAFGVAVGLVSILFPAFSCMSIVEERVQKSLDLLLTTCLAPWEIFAGKLIGSFTYCFTFLVATLPVVTLSFLFGGVEPSAIVAAYVFQLANALLICIIGTYASASSNGAVRAIVTAYVLTIFVGFVIGWATIVPTAYWIYPSMGVFSRGDLQQFEKMLADFGGCFYTGAVLAYVLVGSFFSIAGTNRLKPAAYDRSSSMRGFTVAFFAAGLVYFAYCMTRYVDTSTGQMIASYMPSALFGASLTAIIVACVPLALSVLVFPTEPAQLSRRVQQAIAARLAISPVRLLAPGAGRGMWFCFALVVIVLGALTAYALFGLGIIDFFDAGGVGGTRGELAIAELAAVLASFLLFLAAFGRFLAERARGTAGPRLAVAGIAIACTLIPVIAWTAEDDTYYSGRAGAAARNQWPPPAITRGYFLSPYLAGVSAVEIPRPPDYPRLFLFPEIMRGVRADVPGPAFLGSRFSTTTFAVVERNAVPLHRLTAALYLALAVLFALLGNVRSRRRERAERERAEKAAAARAAPPVAATAAAAVPPAAAGSRAVRREDARTAAAESESGAGVGRLP